MENGGMKRTTGNIYWVLAAVGAVVPLIPFGPWILMHGLDGPHFLSDLFANRISSFFALDLIVSAIVLTVFIVIQGARDRVAGRWWAIAATFGIGVSCGLPLFLALRERAVRRR
jgi:hypothetical protein